MKNFKELARFVADNWIDEHDFDWTLTDKFGELCVMGGRITCMFDTRVFISIGWGGGYASIYEPSVINAGEIYEDILKFLTDCYVDMWCESIDA